MAAAATIDYTFFGLSLIAIVMAGSLAMLWWAWAWRRDLSTRLDNSALSAKEEIEFRISIHEKFTQLVAGTAIAAASIITILQFVESRNTSSQSLFTARMQAGLALSRELRSADRVGGVYTLASLAVADPQFAPYVYDALTSLIRSWSLPHALCDSEFASQRTRPPSIPILPETQAAMTAMKDASAARLMVNMDLSCTSLSRLRMEGAALQGVDLSKSDLSGAKLSRADLRNSDLYAANLYGAELYASNLQHANLPDVDLSSANLGPPVDGKATLMQDVVLTGAVMYGAKLCGGQFTRARMWGAKLDGIKAYNADFRSADLTNASFVNAKLAGANFSGARSDDHHGPNFTCAFLGETRISKNEFCQGDTPSYAKTIRVPAAIIPESLLLNAQLCGTFVNGSSIDRDCPNRTQVCDWEKESLAISDRKL